MKNKCNFYIPIQKVDKEKKMVYGYATTEAVDSQGEVVERSAIKKAWNDYMEFANVREMHQLSAIGKTKEYMHDGKGTWVGVKVVDKTAWDKVVEKVYMGFSIGGEVLKKEGNRIKEIILSEISLVDRPSCPQAKFEMVKRDNNGDLVSNQKVDITNVKKDNMSEDIIKEETSEDETEQVEKTINEDTEENVIEEPEIKEESEEDVEESEEDTEEKPSEEEKEEDKKDDEEEGEEEDEDEEETKKTENEKGLEKDVREMGALSELSTNLNYLIDAFKENERPTAVTSKMDEALQLLLDATRLESKRDEEKVEKVESFEGLSKVLKEELGDFKKSFEESNAKVEKLNEEVASLKEQMGEVQKVKERPKTTYTVEKAEKEEESSLESLRGGMKNILDEIEKTHEEAKALAGSGDIAKQEEISGRLNELQKRFSAQKAELKEFSNKV